MPISCIGCIASVPIKWIEVKEVIYVVEYVSGGGGGDGFLPITFSSLVLLLLVYRMLNEQLEKVNREASDFRLQNAKLASQVSEHSHLTSDRRPPAAAAAVARPTITADFISYVIWMSCCHDNNDFIVFTYLNWHGQHL